MEPIVAGLIGAVLGAVGMWLIERRRPTPSVAWLSSGRRRPWQRSPKPPSVDEIERLQRQQDPQLAIDGSPLLRVIGVGQAQSADGLTVECVSLELRESGGRGLLRTLAPAGGLHGPWREGRLFLDPIPRLEDDMATTYTVSMPGWTGGDRAGEMLFRFAPTPPADARRLVIRAPRTPPFALAAAESADGFWVFEVDLA